MQDLQKTDSELVSMFATARRMARKYGQIGHLEPDDICQQAMIRLLNRTGDRAPTTGWLYKVVRSAAADAGRKFRSEARYVCTYETNDRFGCVCENADESRRVHTSRTYIPRHEMEVDLMPRLQKVLGALSEPLRQVLVLYAEGHSYEEISALMKTSIGTVRSRLHYARKRARALLGDMA